MSTEPPWRGFGACLFDLDGTLIAPSIDFAELNRRVRVVVQRHGLDAAAFVGLPALETIARAREALTGHDAADASRLVAEAHAAILEVELEAAGRVQPFPGVQELLVGLRARGLKVAIVTRNGRQPVERILGRIPLAHDVLLTRDDVVDVKPDPRHLLAALARLGVPRTEAAMVGDHPMDVQAGRRAGLYTIAVLNGILAAEAFAAERPDLIVPRVADLAPVLR